MAYCAYTGSWIPCVGLRVFDSGGRNYKLSIIGKITGFSWIKMCHNNLQLHITEMAKKCAVFVVPFSSWFKSCKWGQEHNVQILVSYWHNWRILLFKKIPVPNVHIYSQVVSDKNYNIFKILLFNFVLKSCTLFNEMDVVLKSLVLLGSSFWGF